MTTQQKLVDFLNLDANDEVHIFLQGDKKKTPQMKYDYFIKTSLATFNVMIRDYVHEVATQMKECKSIKEIEALHPKVMPDHIREAIIKQIDLQKNLNIVEKTYLFLDLFRGVSSNIGKHIGNAAMHYANAFKALENLDNGNGGGRIIGLNGKPLS